LSKPASLHSKNAVRFSLKNSPLLYTPNPLAFSHGTQQIVPHIRTFIFSLSLSLSLSFFHYIQNVPQLPPPFFSNNLNLKFLDADQVVEHFLIGEKMEEISFPSLFSGRHFQKILIQLLIRQSI